MIFGSDEALDIVSRKYIDFHTKLSFNSDDTLCLVFPYGFESQDRLHILVKNNGIWEFKQTLVHSSNGKLCKVLHATISKDGSTIAVSYLDNKIENKTSIQVAVYRLYKDLYVIEDTFYNTKLDKLNIINWYVCLSDNGNVLLVNSVGTKSNIHLFQVFRRNENHKWLQEMDLYTTPECNISHSFNPAKISGDGNTIVFNNCYIKDDIEHGKTIKITIIDTWKYKEGKWTPSSVFKKLVQDSNINSSYSFDINYSGSLIALSNYYHDNSKGLVNVIYEDGNIFSIVNDKAIENDRFGWGISLIGNDKIKIYSCNIRAEKPHSTEYLYEFNRYGYKLLETRTVNDDIR